MESSSSAKKKSSKKTTQYDQQIWGENYDYIFKVIMVGDQSVGKSNLLLRYTKNEYNPFNQVTIGIEFASKFIKIESDQ